MTTPAQVWADGFNLQYQATLAYYRNNGYTLSCHVLYQGRDCTVREVCRMEAEEYAMFFRGLFLENNPDWMEQVCRS